MRIASARPAEYPALVTLWEASVRATHDFLSEADIAFFKPLILTEFLPAVELHCARCEAGRVLGFLGLSGGKDGRTVEMLFLAPEERGKGIGRRLMEFAIRERDARRVDVNEQNPQARAFYEHLGFRVVSRSGRDGMGKPFPLLHMELEAARGIGG